MKISILLCRYNTQAFITLLFSFFLQYEFFDKTAMTVRIVSYNVLVPLFDNQPQKFTKCQREFLQTDHR